MGISQNIISILKEAELYQKQGLLAEAKSKYQEVVNVLTTHQNLENADKIKISVLKKIKEIEKEILYVEKKVLSPFMTKESQDLITRMFVSSDGEDPNVAVLEGAKALIKFGQFERAVEELNQLLEVENFKAEAAKQILNCHLLSSKANLAIEQYERWKAVQFFLPDQLDKLKVHIQDYLKNAGTDKDYPKIFDIQEPADAHLEIETSVSPGEGVEKEESLVSKRDTFFFEEEFEEYDPLASGGKKKKPDGK